ncbi:MAG: High-affinity zinc uptake system binding-protein ZnuA [Chlamydiae bacterium]|nr:High-affinity zinc uptake system binding-protein ZnuA [Chlamydiota bacterium]
MSKKIGHGHARGHGHDLPQLYEKLRLISICRLGHICRLYSLIFMFMMTFRVCISLFLVLFVVTFFSSCKREDEPRPLSRSVVVSIAPYKFFVEEIAGNTIDVDLMVPTGGSPHSYEPTTRQILATSKADIWFQIGESFEARAFQALKSYNPEMEVIDMRKGIDLIDEKGHVHCHHHNCKDPHIWLSPRLVKKQAEVIAATLSQHYPEHAERYEKSLRKFQQKLDGLDVQIGSIVQQAKSRSFLVSHPAYAYFCRDYGLMQLSIEFEGKEPTPQHLTEVLNRAREMGAKVVFIQAQHLSKGARLVAEELDAEVVELDPLDENYFENMLHIAKSIAAQ